LYLNEKVKESQLWKGGAGGRAAVGTKWGTRNMSITPLLLPTIVYFVVFVFFPF